MLPIIFNFVDPKTSIYTYIATSTLVSVVRSVNCKHTQLFCLKCYRLCSYSLVSDMYILFPPISLHHLPTQWAMLRLLNSTLVMRPTRRAGWLPGWWLAIEPLSLVLCVEQWTTTLQLSLATALVGCSTLGMGPSRPSGEREAIGDNDLFVPLSKCFALVPLAIKILNNSLFKCFDFCENAQIVNNYCFWHSMISSLFHVHTMEPV